MDDFSFDPLANPAPPGTTWGDKSYAPIGSSQDQSAQPYKNNSFMDYLKAVGKGMGGNNATQQPGAQAGRGNFTPSAPPPNNLGPAIGAAGSAGLLGSI